MRWKSPTGISESQLYWVEIWELSLLSCLILTVSISRASALFGQSDERPGSHGKTAARPTVNQPTASLWSVAAVRRFERSNHITDSDLPSQVRFSSWLWLDAFSQLTNSWMDIKLEHNAKCLQSSYSFTSLSYIQYINTYKSTRSKENNLKNIIQTANLCRYMRQQQQQAAVGPSVVALKLRPPGPHERRVGWPKRHRASGEQPSPHSLISCGRARARCRRFYPACWTHYCLRLLLFSTSSSHLPTRHPLVLHLCLCLVCTQTQRDAACNHRRTQFQGQFQGYLLSRVNKERKKTQRSKDKKRGDGGKIKKDFHKKWKQKSFLEIKKITWSGSCSLFCQSKWLWLLVNQTKTEL